MRQGQSNKVRFLIIAIGFCLICAAFIGVLGTVGSRGTTLPKKESGYTRTYTLPGVRGEIYDRNGVKLVGNADTYDLVYEYGAMPDTRGEVNRSLLDILEQLEKTGNMQNLSEDYFVLEGIYPNMSFVPEVKDKESNEYYHYQKFLKNQKLSTSRTDAEDVASYFVKRYKLSSELYSNEEITSLIRLYYEMERAGFGQYASYTVASGVNLDLVTAIKEKKNIQGANFEVRSERVYLYPGIASHILGRVGRITAETMEYYLDKGYELDALVGTSGCEEAFEEYLRCSDGIMEVKYDDNGKKLSETVLVEPTSGNDVYLTIDIELQITAEEALKENVEMFEGSDAGAVTVLDPDSGDALAIASYPTYDLSLFSSRAYYNSLVQNTNLPLYNRALQGVYAPGSTYKIGVAMAALEMGAVDSYYQCNCKGYYYADDRNSHTCLHNHGLLNVVGAIRESCNIFFYTLGEKMGIDAITSYTKPLGLGADTGIELGDKNGIVAGPAYREEIGGRQWQTGDNLSAAIGQSDHGYTPLQMSVYMSTVVNGGTRYKVNLLESVRKFHSHEVIVEAKPTALDTVEFSESTYNTLIDAMEQVVSSNSTLNDKYFADVKETVGGKTGTAEVAGKRDYAVFCGFAPLYEPEIVVTCIIEEGVYGQRAAYATGKIMERYFELYGEAS